MNTIGMAADRIGNRTTFPINFMLIAIAFISLVLTEEVWVLYLIAGVFGFAYGGIITLQPLLAAELFGLSSLGVILGSVTFGYTIGGAAGPVVSGRIFDISGSYRLAFVVCGILAVIGIILALSLTPLKTERGEHHTP